MKSLISLHREGGAETIEFAFISVFYFFLLLGIFEFARALSTWNLLAEATRRGARMATVCPYQSPIPINVAVFDDINGSLGGPSPIVNGLTTTNVNIRYLDNSGNVIDVAAGGLLSDIAFVEASLNNFQYQMLFTDLFALFVPDWTGALTSPTFLTTLPAESLGAVPTLAPPALPTTCSY